MGDNLLKGGISSFVKKFKKSNYASMILLTQVENPQRFGVAKIDKKGRLIQLIEKPKEPPSNFALTCIYFFKPIIFEMIKRARAIRRSWKTALLIVIVAATAIAVSTLISMWLSRYTNFHFQNTGTIYTIGVEAYWDQNLTNRTSQIQWGTLYAGTKINMTVYLHSISNIPTTLSLKTENWTFVNLAGTNVTEPPNREAYMNLTWDYNNQTFNPNQTIQATLTLAVTGDPVFLQYLIQNSVATFSFDITVNARESAHASR